MDKMKNISTGENPVIRGKSDAYKLKSTAYPHFIHFLWIKTGSVITFYKNGG